MVSGQRIRAPASLLLRGWWQNRCAPAIKRRTRQRVSGDTGLQHFVIEVRYRRRLSVSPRARYSNRGGAGSERSKFSFSNAEGYREVREMIQRMSNNASKNLIIMFSHPLWLAKRLSWGERPETHQNPIAHTDHELATLAGCSGGNILFSPYDGIDRAVEFWFPAFLHYRAGRAVGWESIYLDFLPKYLDPTGEGV